ncbi:MAG: hypothetical protein HC875_08580 [Anaerolineales bacterium]|nr:hypothetical protein [Anaerolineales bacterium]
MNIPESQGENEQIVNCLELRDAVILAKRSDAYRSIRNQLADFKPYDVWEDEDHIVVEFILKEYEGMGIKASIESLALFILAKQQHILVDARIVKPDREGTNIEVKSLLFPIVNFAVPIPPLNSDA